MDGTGDEDISCCIRLKAAACRGLFILPCSRQRLID
jgi:hypothetical protein